MIGFTGVVTLNNLEFVDTFRIDQGGLIPQSTGSTKEFKMVHAGRFGNDPDAQHG